MRDASETRAMTDLAPPSVHQNHKIDWRKFSVQPEAQDLSVHPGKSKMGNEECRYLRRKSDGSYAPQSDALIQLSYSHRVCRQV